MRYVEAGSYNQPIMLLLDESVNHLDASRKRRINDVISRLNITRIIIAHRPETVASADRVVQLDNQDLGTEQAVEAPTATPRARVRAGEVPVA